MPIPSLEGLVAAVNSAPAGPPEPPVFNNGQTYEWNAAQQQQYAQQLSTWNIAPPAAASATPAAAPYVFNPGQTYEWNAAHGGSAVGSGNNIAPAQGAAGLPMNALNSMASPTGLGSTYEQIAANGGPAVGSGTNIAPAQGAAGLPMVPAQGAAGLPMVPGTTGGYSLQSTSPAPTQQVGPDGMPIHGLTVTKQALPFDQATYDKSLALVNNAAAIPQTQASGPNGPANWPTLPVDSAPMTNAPNTLNSMWDSFIKTVSPGDPYGYANSPAGQAAKAAAMAKFSANNTTLPGQPQFNSFLTSIGVTGIPVVGATIPFGPGASPSTPMGPQGVDTNYGNTGTNAVGSAQADSSIAAQGATMPNSSLNPNGNQGGITPSPGSNLGYPPSLYPPSTTQSTSANVDTSGASGAVPTTTQSTSANVDTSGASGAVPITPATTDAGKASNGANGDGTTPNGGTVTSAGTGGGILGTVGNFIKDNAVPLAIGASAIGSGISTAAASNTQADAAIEAAKSVAAGNAAALTQQQNQFNTIQANNLPFLTAGQNAVKQLDPNQPGSVIANHHDFSSADMKLDDGYQFNLSEGLKALQNSAAARGQLQSGNTMKAVQQYGQQAASNEYQNAYNRYQTDYGTKLNSLQSLAGVGQTAVGMGTQAGMNMANNASSLAQSTGQANAMGQVGAAGATASGYTGLGNIAANSLNSVLGYGLQQQYLNK